MAAVFLILAVGFGWLLVRFIVMGVVSFHKRWLEKNREQAEKAQKTTGGGDG